MIDSGDTAHCTACADNDIPKRVVSGKPLLTMLRDNDIVNELIFLVIMQN